jgi:DNA-binding NarL/FixJ family response regulator
VLLTTVDLDEYVHRALRAGAVGLLLKEAPAHDLIAAVRSERALRRGHDVPPGAAAWHGLELHVDQPAFPFWAEADPPSAAAVTGSAEQRLSEPAR